MRGRSFLKELFRRCPQDLWLHTFEPRERMSHPTLVRDLRIPQSDELWYTVGLCTAPVYGHRRPKQADVVCTPGVWVDIDLASPAHASERLPPIGTPWTDLLAGTGLPTPTLVIDSGWGLHLWWLWSAPIVTAAGAPALRDAVTTVQAVLASHFRKRGWRLDTTSDLSRALRLPGSLNAKIPTDLKLCRVVEQHDTYYTPSDFITLRAADWVPQSVLTAPTGDIPAVPLDAMERWVVQRAQYDALWAAIMRGEPYATPGNRHHTLISLTMALANKFPGNSATDLLTVLLPSLHAAAIRDPEWAFTDAQALRYCEGALRKARMGVLETSQRLEQIRRAFI